MDSVFISCYVCIVYVQSNPYSFGFYPSLLFLSSGFVAVHLGSSPFLAPVMRTSLLRGLTVLVLALMVIYIIVHLLINIASAQWEVMGSEALCGPVCMLCFSPLLYKYRITVFVG